MTPARPSLPLSLLLPGGRLATLAGMVALLVRRNDMLQHTEVDRVLLPPLRRAAGSWQDMAELEQAADAAVARLRGLRSEEAARHGLLRRLAVRLDDWVRTDAPEYLDDPDFPPERKQRIVQALHRFNQGVFAYRRFFNVLLPLIRPLASQRPVRILELASGSGEFSFALAKLAAKRGIAVEVTGSDYFMEHVEAGNAKARARGSDVRFIQVNAFDMGALDEDSYDIVFIAQSIHHFSPGQVAMMVAQAARVAGTAFVGIDGRRSPEIYAIASVPAVLPLLYYRSLDYVHDALLSARKFYTESELELIARIAAPDAFVSVRAELPGYSVLTVAS